MTTAAPKPASERIEPRMSNGTLHAHRSALPPDLGASRGTFEPQSDPASLGIRPEDVIRHGSCGRWWTGPARNHCGRCHITTSGLTAFDAHQRGGVCAHPQAAGLVARSKPWGTVWALPADEDAMARLKAVGSTPDSAE